MKQSENYIKRRVGDQFVLIAVGEASKRFPGMVTLNETGAFIWDALAEEKTTDELVAAITAEYDVDAAKAKEDAEKLLSVLSEVGAVE